MCVTLFAETELELIDRERRMVGGGSDGQVPRRQKLGIFDFKAMPSLTR